MALNLSKKDQDNNESSSQKKGLNLSKSDSSNKNKFNLSKEEVDTANSQDMPSKHIEEKKKTSVLYIIVAILIIGIGGYWIMSEKGDSQTVSSNQLVDSLATNNLESSQPVVDSANLSSSSATTPPDIQPVTSSNSTDAVKESTTAEISSPKPTILDNSSSVVDQKVREVIDGKFGNGEDRKLALGGDYKAIQAKVNALYRSRKQ